MSDREKHDSDLAMYIGMAEAQSDEIQALRAEVERLQDTCRWCGVIHGLGNNTCCPYTMEINRAEALQQQLDAVRGLPEKWRSDEIMSREQWVLTCADELERELAKCG